MLTFLFWYFIVSVSALALLGVLVVYDYFKYGVWVINEDDELS